MKDAFPAGWLGALASCSIGTGVHVNVILAGAFLFIVYICDVTTMRHGAVQPLTLDLISLMH